MNWVSEAEELPPIAQPILLAAPRQGGEFWDLTTAQLLVQYEGVVPRPVPKGTRWPTTYYWERNLRGGSANSHPILVTGNAWWALLDEIPLPPGAEHRSERGRHYVVQPQPIFVGQVERHS
jgi:hypothetical protein